ncbi:DUF2062 domain-containing protein [Ectothiorhodospiraceae bacterium BW-2]|nr:DUF2062 domain-containing protein [Ectothiorhodospiraceae bacterium BW-2]
MPRLFIKRMMPNNDTIRNHQQLRHLAPWLADPKLWHLNRRSAAGAVATGLFIAWIPIPFQMVLAALVAIVLRINMPITIVFVWISNPITMPAMFFFAYKLGALLLGLEPKPFQFELSWEWLFYSMGAMWQPFLLGCFICGICSAAAGFLGLRLLWRQAILNHIKARKLRQKIALKIDCPK